MTHKVCNLLEICKKMKLKIATSFVLLLVSMSLMAQNYTVSGTITDQETGKPVDFATVVLQSSEQWAVADAKGTFVIKNVPSGDNVLSVSCLGYVTVTKELSVNGNIKDLNISLVLDNLRLESAVVTAKENSNSAATSRTIDKVALEHVQVMNVTDIGGLLPGGKTSSSTLTSTQTFSIRGGGSFGTAVEVDGVRLSNNASFSSASGVSTNNIASSNVESVEVITGVPSVEYGDMTSGVVKINTRRGKTPWAVTMSTSPLTKQVSLNKGFSLGTSRTGASLGVLNSTLEYTRSVSNKMSPFTSYDRKQLALTYSRQFAEGFFADKPLRLSAGITGNLGGYDDKADPDRMLETFSTGLDNTLRGNISANWLLSKPWITNVEFKASAAYSDKHSRARSRYSESTSSVSMHATEEGYYVGAPWVDGGQNLAVMLAPGIWYNTMASDDRPLNTRVSLKANWAKNAGRINNKLKVGAEWTADKNFGVGLLAEEPATAPSWREYRYCDVPTMSNIAAYIEDNFLLRLTDDSNLNLIAGLRNDNTVIPGSAYGVTSSISPRFNVKWTVFTEKSHADSFFKELSFRAGWGVASKQPSFAVLYPAPGYTDSEVFRSTASSDNTVYRANYVMPRTIEYNPDLRWQRDHQAEAGIDMNLGGVRISLAGYYTKTIGAYSEIENYRRFTYNFTGPNAVQGIDIPVDNRAFAIDGNGIVTVSDKTGALPSVTLPGIVRNEFIPTYTEDNDDNPVTRCGLEWVIDFPRIKAINTTIRFDGNYFSTRSVYSDLLPYYLNNRQSAADNTKLLPYLGWYYGGHNTNNGSESSSVKGNLTFTTNIPKVGLILSLKLEGNLYTYSRTLSERADGSARSYVLTDKTDPLSFIESKSIYDEEGYTVFFPESYSTFDDPQTQIPFLEKFRWAKENDPAMYTDLANLLITNTTENYTYMKEYLSPSFNAHFSVTKEIGKIASISFYANNFINMRNRIWSTRTKSWLTMNPSVYYGLTLRLYF